MDNRPNLEFLPSKQIAALLNSLPSPELLLLIKSIDQIHCFSRLGGFCQLVAAAWIAQQNFQPDPLEALRKAGYLSQNDYNRISRHVTYYQRLWVLVQLTEPFIRLELEQPLKQAGIPYFFQHPYELFTCIVQEQINNEFSVCLKPYHEFSASKHQKKYKRLARLLEGESLPEEELRGVLLTPTPERLKRHAWSTFLIAVARKRATRNRVILQDALEDFFTAAARIFEVEGTHTRKGGSFAWIDGERVKGSKNGTYKPKNP